jgi:hypothetical protein
MKFWTLGTNTDVLDWDLGKGRRCRLVTLRALIELQCMVVPFFAYSDERRALSEPVFCGLFSHCQREMRWQ